MSEKPATRRVRVVLDYAFELEEPVSLDAETMSAEDPLLQYRDLSLLPDVQWYAMDASADGEIEGVPLPDELDEELFDSLTKVRRFEVSLLD